MKSLLPLLFSAMVASAFAADRPPNVILIYADDLGYGDLSCYGATKIQTPNIDRLAREGRRFTDAHATSATCTPSRFALLTGVYPWRRSDAKILPGNAPALIAPGTVTFPSLLQKAGYATGVVGKWHLGLGGERLDWNGEIKPGPLEIGFNYAFLLPATGDRVPCVYVENHRVVGLDPADPISVSYGQPIGNDPTGKANPELLKYRFSHGHDQTIVNGISRIGYMSGGKAARWVDEDMADVFARKVDQFIEQHRARPFFLYFATHDIHVPRLPHARFVGKSGLGLRGDAILQFDWSVGQVLATLDRLGLAANTLVIVSSDNGPVVDDGYHDGSVEHLRGHTPSGPLRGGKYSAFEAGTRVPFLARWPARIKPGVSAALFSQLDLPATFAALAGQAVPAGALRDSRNAVATLVGDDSRGRDHVIEHAANGRLSVRTATWKYIEPGTGPARNPNVGIDLGNSPSPQLFDLRQDSGEKQNVAADQPAKVAEMKALLDRARGG
ncbi:MAG: arylsulfatase [Verrucomicrobia bacterium]|nr:arylsulfatase [Verrucomicrobiota bacterium]